MTPPRFGHDIFTAMVESAPSRRALLHHAAAGALVLGAGAALHHTAPAAAQADEAPPPVPVPGPQPAHRVRIGHLDLRVLDDGAFAVTGPILAVNGAPAAVASSLAAVGLRSEGFSLPIHPLLIESAGQRILVDTGNGGFDPASGRLLAALRAEGIAPEEIDVVLFTHLHPDHFGGAVDANGKPVFASARYLVNRAEYDYWWSEPSLAELPFPAAFRQFVRTAAKDALVALRNRIEQIEPGDEVVPGVAILDAPGHTPGHVAIALSSEGERLLHISDAALVPALHLEHPEWFLAPDNWPAQALMTRRQLLDRAVKEELLVATHHFPFPGLGYIREAGDGWRWESAV